MDFFTFFGLAIAMLFSWKAAAALASGRIDVGWAFEPIVAHRDKDTFFFWFMLSASILMALAGLAGAIHTILFPTT